MVYWKMYLMIFMVICVAKVTLATPHNTAKVPVEYSLADGWIQTRGGATCKDLGYNATTTGSMGVNGYTKCLPDGKTENHTIFYSFNTSNYSGCTINSATLHYNVNTIYTNPRTFVWNPMDYNSLLEVYVASDRIGTQLDFTDAWFPNEYVNTINPALITSIGWRNVTIPNSNISNGFLDIEIRPNKDYWQEMNDETKTKTFTVRTTEYAGVTSDPYLEINYTAGVCGTCWNGIGNWNITDKISPVICTNQVLSYPYSNITLGGSASLTLINTLLGINLGSNYVSGEGTSYLSLDGTSYIS